MKKSLRARVIYALIFVVLVMIEFIIALYVHDKFIRPYMGDVIIIVVLCCFVRMIIPCKIKLLPLYLFMLSVAVEIGQYFDYVNLLRLSGSRFFRVLLGTSFSFIDIICYAAGTGICVLAEVIRNKRQMGVEK